MAVTKKRVYDGITAAFVLLFIASAFFFAFGPFQRFFVVGESMEPALYERDIVFVVEKDSYEVGDVIVFHSNIAEFDVVHRIVTSYEDGFLTRGDNNFFVDAELVHESQIKGAVSFRFDTPLFERIAFNPVAIFSMILLLALFAFIVLRDRSSERSRLQRNVGAPVS